MIGIGLRQLEEVITEHADSLQRKFIQLSSTLDDLGKQMLELRGDEKKTARMKQKDLRMQQQELAEEINRWRKRARDVTHQSGMQSLLAYLDELESLGVDGVSYAVKRTRQLMESGGDGETNQPQAPAFREQTAVQRLLERARTDYILRGTDVGVREREAVTFANQTGMAQNDQVLQELRAGLDDGDPLVREVAYLAIIQLLRFRAVRLADLDAAHLAVKELAKLNHTAVIPVLIEILEQPRSGFVHGDQEADNGSSRLVALLRLVEWHTADAEQAVRGRLRDRDKQIVRVASRALDLFPAPWTGPLKKPTPAQGQGGGTQSTPFP